MKTAAFLLIITLALASCGNNNNDANMKDPNKTHSEEEAVPHSMDVKNDSVIAPANDTASKGSPGH